MDYVKVGNIVNTFGLKGELKVESLSDFTEMRFRPGQELLIEYKKDFDIVIVKTMRYHKGFVLVSFKGLEDINLVEKYKGCDIYISRDHIQALPLGEYYFFELKGCDVYENNAKIGEVSDVEEGYQTILRIATSEKEVLVPYVPAFIKKVDIASRRIDVSLIEGFL